MPRLLLFALISPLLIATSNIESMTALEARLKKNPNQTKVREELSERYFSAGQYKKVIEILAPYSNEISNDGLIRLSEAYEQDKDYLGQIRALKMYEQREPNRFRPQYLLGEAYKNNKQFDEAVQSFRKAIEFAPRHRPSYDGILAILMDKKDYYEARTLVAQMIRVFGEKPELLSRQCHLFSDGGFLAEAEATCKKALVKDKNKPDNHVYLAQALMNQGRKQAAESVFKNAARRFPNSELVQFAVGEYYFNEKNYATAARYLEQGIKLKPDSARSLLGLALSLFELKKWSEALPHFAKACELDETRTAYNEFRSAAAKIRQANDNKMAEQYDRKIATCK